MHHLRVVTWNAEGMFVKGSRTRRATPHDALKALKKLNADIVFVPEFGDTDKLDDAILTAIHSLGYQTIVFSYTQPHLDEYGAALLTRIPLRSHILHHFKNTGRTFIEAILTLDGDKDALRIIGLHLDDTQERLRLEQIDQVSLLINKDHVGETIVLGDFNAMSMRSLGARVLATKSAGAVGARLPHALLRSMSRRVNQMASGHTIAKLLKTTALHDLDIGHQLTISAKQAGLEWAPKLRLAKIDWIFGSKNIVTVSYKVSSDVGSDHRPVCATITIK